MEWIILFAVSWILFFLLADWKRLKANILCGLLAIVLQMSIDTAGINHGFYEINNALIKILGSSLFFVLGPVLTIASLLAQLHPGKWWMRVLNVFVLAALFSIQEWLLLVRGALKYTNWNTVNSIMVNICAMIIFSWITIVVLDRKGQA